MTLALAWWGVPRPERAERAREALRAIGAEHLARRRAATLSGGERRRVHLARAIAVQPDVLLLDEPFAGLDAEVRANLLEDALSALRSSDRATLVVVHDRAEAWALADRLLILIDGRLVAAGPPRELLERPPSTVVARFLGFDGSLEDGHELLLTRPAHVALDPAGPLEARVTRAVALEDGVRLELELEHGRLYVVSPLPAPRPGDSRPRPDRRRRTLPARRQLPPASPHGSGALRWCRAPRGESAAGRGVRRRGRVGTRRTEAIAFVGSDLERGDPGAATVRGRARPRTPRSAEAVLPRARARTRGIASPGLRPPR